MFVRDGARLLKVPKPDDANAYTVRGQLVIELRSDWTVDGRTWPQGALLATTGLSSYAMSMAAGSAARCRRPPSARSGLRRSIRPARTSIS
jgi:hypothetical protein